MVIESYAAVFEQERRLHSMEVDPVSGKRWQLPVNGGIPLRGVAYYLVAFWVIVPLCVLAVLIVPPFGWAFGLLPLVLQVMFVLVLAFGVPGGMAYAAMVARVDGRPAHLWLLAWASWRLREKRTCNGRRVPREGERYKFSGRLKVRWDLSSPRLQRTRVRGPARVAFAVPVRFSMRTHGWRARWDADGRLCERAVPRGEILDVVPSRSGERRAARRPRGDARHHYWQRRRRGEWNAAAIPSEDLREVLEVRP